MNNFNINATIPYVSKERLNPSLQNFFKVVLDEFQRELQLIASQWYNYENEHGAGTDDIFALIERTYVGIFNNAIIRLFPNDAVVQEFSVEVGKGKYNRCDYLVKHWHKGNSINLMFEAKQRQFDGKDYSPEESKSFLADFLNQGRGYFEAEKQFYLGAQTYVVSLVFEWVRYLEHLKQAFKYSNDCDDGVTDFFCFYHTDTAGLMVYGNVELQINN